MRFTVEVVRTQVLERTVRAADDQAAYEKVQAEIDKPWGTYGWETRSVDMRVVNVDSTVEGIPLADGQGGPELYSVKGAAERLGLSRSVVYELIRSGELAHVSVGRRKLISRAAMTAFIEDNTRMGYYSS
jgi:excisionase family DNA binding protein